MLSRTKYFFISFLLLSFLLSGCVSSSPDLKIKNLPSVWDQKDLKWGVTINPYPTGKHTPEVLEKVIQDAKELGVDWVRIGFTYDYNFMDPVINAANVAQLTTILGLSPGVDNVDFFSFDDPYQHAFEQGSEMAQHYQNQIKYYQLANEPAASCIKRDWPGIDKDSFDLDKCQKVIRWLEGAAAGIKKINPQAKILITGHWLHIGFFQMLIEKNVDFDIIGWDCNGMNYSLTKVKNGSKEYDLVELLKKLNKELWVTELNSESGSLKGEEKQAKYIEKFVQEIYGLDSFQGIFAFMLHDEVHRVGTEDGGNGLIKLTKSKDSIWNIGEKKRAYYTFQSLIKELR